MTQWHPFDTADDWLEDKSANNYSFWPAGPRPPVWTNTAGGSAYFDYLWDGASEYGYFAPIMGNPAIYEPSEFSLFAWIRYESAGYEAAVYGNATYTLPYVSIYEGTATYDFHVMFKDSGGDYIGRYAVAHPANNWHSIGVSYDGSKSVDGIKLYRNGILLSSTPETSGTYDGMNMHSATVGSRDRTGNGGSYWFDGYLGDRRMFNRVLTTNEFFVLHNSTKDDY
jgi:hypothetical protein